MNENEIADSLKQNTPKPYETDIAPTTPQEPSVGVTLPPAELDELTQYKLHDYFGQEYKTYDDESKQRIQFIYETVSKMVQNDDFGIVLTKIRDLETIIGTAHDERRAYKLYQWLRLETMRRSIDTEMGALTYARG